MTTGLPLQDIVEQPAVGWWPLAWGWWLLLGLALLLSMMAVWLYWRRQRHLQPLKQARNELPQCQRVEQCNQLLKRVLRHYQPDLWAEPIGHSDWLAVLSSQLPVAQRDAFVHQAQPGFSQLYTGRLNTHEWQQAYAATLLWLNHYHPPGRLRHV